MILKTAANMQEHGYIETGKEGGYYEVDGQRTEIGGGGGGGDSRFSIAEVTIINSLSSALALPMPCISESATIEGGVLSIQYTANPGTSTTEAVLYQNDGFINMASFSEHNIEVSGNATFVKGVVGITGDCTVTIE